MYICVYAFTHIHIHADKPRGMRGCECGAASNCVNGDDTDCRPGHWLPPNIGTPAPGDPRLIQYVLAMGGG